MVPDDPGTKTVTFTGCQDGRTVVHVGVDPVPWSAVSEGPNPPMGQCGQAHNIPMTIFFGGTSRYIWDFFTGK